MVAAGEPGHVGGVAGHGGGDDRAGAEDLGDGGARGADGDGEFLLRLAHLGVQRRMSARSSAASSPRAWREVLLAATLQGAIFAAVKAALDRGAAAGARQLTGVWPGDEGQQSGQET